MSGHPRKRRLVYSTATGRACGACGRPAADCTCGRKPDPPAGDGVVRVRLEKKGRRGKSVTTVAGVRLAAGELRSLAAELKRACGTGGAVKEGVIEIQGDQRDRIVAALERKGYMVKRAG